MDGSLESQTTYGFLDMGGASTQIAFEPQAAYVDDEMTPIDVRLRLSGEDIQHKVFVTTTATTTIVNDPCLPMDLGLDERPVHVGPTTDHAKKTHRLVGTGSFEQCMKKTAPLLNNSAPCPDTPCLMNGVHVRLLGVTLYWCLGILYERPASKFCSRTWASIAAEHEKSRSQNHILSGDGEVEKDGKIVEVGNWSDNVEISRLQMQCFKAAWVANVLHEGIGMPRIVDPGGNNTTDGEKVAEQAENKGLGRPTFQSVDTASKEVPPLVETSQPAVDPLDESVNVDSPIKPIRPLLDLIEHRLEGHLPKTLTRSSLGFLPVLLHLDYFPRSPKLSPTSFSRPGSPTHSSKRWPQPFRRFFTFWRSVVPHTHRPASQHFSAYNGNGSGVSPASMHTPPRSPNRPPMASSAFGSTTASSRSSSPRPAFLGLDESGIGNGVSGLSACSRNSSQKNLTLLVPRSRVPSSSGDGHY
ncbi:hypothetical protein GGX14DRAFT_696077 [Mycena pura]|uniref:Uncharacterized protein n=1 Tax=Mycena pura TaxID=153505 RepID=A0AAD6VNB1_9AGAR|nr:hypothetical protein GGX14DRAFT_696077 [Mycena pura]